MKKLNQKGITLIALIITIIVMMILVGVTVAVVQEGGLFTKAELAVTETEKAKEKEMLQAAAIGAYDTTLGRIDLEEFRENLPEGWEIEETEKNFICTSPTGNKVIVGADGTLGNSIKNNTAKVKAGYKFAYVGLDTWNNANGFGYNMEADEEINITTNPTIPAQIKYKDGTTEDITLYAKGENAHDDNWDGVVDLRCGYWVYYINGNIVDNGNGTYTGDSTGGYISLESYSYSNDDVVSSDPYKETHYIYIKDYNEGEVANKLLNFETITILDEVVTKQEAWGFDIRFDKEDSEQKFWQKRENITRIIATLPDGTEMISQELILDEENVVYAGFETIVYMAIYQGEDIPQMIELLWSRCKEISKITIEEESNGEITRTTIEIDMNAELPYKHLSE